MSNNYKRKFLINFSYILLSLFTLNLICNNAKNKKFLKLVKNKNFIWYLNEND
jgi:hypothetical protein